MKPFGTLRASTVVEKWFHLTAYQTPPRFDSENPIKNHVVSIYLGRKATSTGYRTSLIVAGQVYGVHSFDTYRIFLRRCGYLMW